MVKKKKQKQQIKPRYADREIQSHLIK